MSQVWRNPVYYLFCSLLDYNYWLSHLVFVQFCAKVRSGHPIILEQKKKNAQSSNTFCSWICVFAFDAFEIPFSHSSDHVLNLEVFWLVLRPEQGILGSSVRFSFSELEILKFWDGIKG